MGAVARQTVWTLVILGNILAVIDHPLADTGEWFPGQIPWGKTREEIQRGIHEETKTVSSNRDILAFRSKVLGEEAVIECTFARDRLAQVRCIFARYAGDGQGLPPATDGQWLRDFLKVRKRLVKRLGQPQETGSATSREDAKALEVLLEVKDPKTLGFMEDAIRRGTALWYTSWRTYETWTTLLLTGGRGLMRMEVRCCAIQKEKNENQEEVLAEQ